MNKFEEDVRKLRKKAELTRHCHSVLGEEQGKYGLQVSTFVVFGSAVSVVTMMADWGSVFGEKLGPYLSGGTILLSTLIFIAEVISRHFKWMENAKAREAKVLELTN